MRQALELAKQGLGQTFPNPAVGCVIVKDGQVVGEGFHPKAGMPHAEVYALRGAGGELGGQGPSGGQMSLREGQRLSLEAAGASCHLPVPGPSAHSRHAPTCLHGAADSYRLLHLVTHQLPCRAIFPFMIPRLLVPTLTVGMPPLACKQPQVPAASSVTATPISIVCITPQAPRHGGPQLT